MGVVKISSLKVLFFTVIVSTMLSLLSSVLLPVNADHLASATLRSDDGEFVADFIGRSIDGKPAFRVSALGTGGR